MLTTKDFKAWAKTQHLDTLRELVACKDSWFYAEHDEEMLRDSIMDLLRNGGVVGSQFYGPEKCIEELCEALEVDEHKTPEDYVTFLRTYDPS